MPLGEGPAVADPGSDLADPAHRSAAAASASVPAPAPVREPPSSPAPAGDGDARREEAIQKIRQGFEDLSRLITSIGANVRDQAEASQGIRERMDALPQLLDESRRGNRAGEELLGLLNQEVSEAGLRQRESLQILRVLPVALRAMQENDLASYQVLAGIREDLARRAERDREMGEHFKEFGATLASLRDVARLQVRHIQALGKVQKGLVTGFQKTQARTVEAFELGQERSLEEIKAGQGRAVHAFAQSQERLRRGLFWAAGAVAAAMLVALAVVLAVWTRAVNDLDRGFRAVESRASALEEKTAGRLQDRDREVRRLRQALQAREAGEAGTVREGSGASGEPARG
jgi:hypothetical protein